MRSRLAILSMLVLGMVLSTGGAGLAVSGFTSGNEVASTAQYGVATPGGGEVLGEENNGGGAGPQENNGGPTQPARQVESGAQAGGQLPFTGFAAIPILVGGVALLGTGLVMRRRTADES